MRWIVSLLGVLIVLLLVTELSPRVNRRGSFSDLQSPLIRAGSEPETSLDHFIANDELRRINAQGGGINFLFVGLRQLEECDTCSNNYADAQKGVVSKHYWVLSGFYGQTLDREFYKQRDYYRSSSEEPRIASTLNDAGPDVSVLFPMSKRSFQFWRIVLLAVMIPVGLFCLYSLLMLVHVFENIALGRAFDPRNSRILFRAACVLAAFSLAVPLGTQLLFWSFGRSIPISIEYPFWEALFEMKWVIAAAIVIFMLARAFKMGYRLQQEHSLTV
ncbi:MAG: DUF2975 domain-containing protein [Chitinophagaceae bacterium]